MAEFTRRVGLGRPLTYQEADDNFEFVEEQADAAEQSAQQAALSAIAAEQSKNAAADQANLAADQANLAADQVNLAAGHANDAQMYAGAAQAAAGIPTFSGHAGEVLTVNSSETGVEYQERVDLDSEQTLKNKVLDEGFSEAVTASEGASITVGLTPFNKKLLTSNLTVSVLLDEGVSRTLWINPQTFTVTWPAGTQWAGGFAPELPANKWSLITFTGLPSQMSNTDGFGALLWSQP